MITEPQVKSICISETSYVSTSYVSTWYQIDTKKKTLAPGGVHGSPNRPPTVKIRPLHETHCRAFMRQDASDQRTLPHLVDLVGDSGCGLEVPGDEGAVGGVSAHAVGTRDEVGAASQEQDVQGLLDVCLVHVHHLQAAKRTQNLTLCL